MRPHPARKLACSLRVCASCITEDKCFEAFGIRLISLRLAQSLRKPCLKMGNDIMRMFGLHFTPLKCEILLQDCIGSKLTLALAQDQLGEVDRYSHLDG